MVQTPNSRELVHQQDKIKLYRYKPKCKRVHSVPLLIVFSTVNRPDVLDLFPEQSFINGLLLGGQDVYLLDWGYPDLKDIKLAFSDYISNYLHHCVMTIKNISQQEKINLLGICQGGVISLCYSSLSNLINKLVLISTPVDFHTKDNLITSFTQQLDTAVFSQLPTNIPGSWLAQFFATLRPFEVKGLKYLKFMDNIHDADKTKKFLRVEQWLADTPDQPSAAFSEFIQCFYQKNQLCKSHYQINGKSIDLNQLAIPVLNIIAKNDEIIPPSASLALKKYISPEYYTQKVYSSGHIGIYINSVVTNKLSKAIGSWLNR